MVPSNAINLPGKDGGKADINSSGQVVGECWDGFLWNADVWTNLGAFYPQSINDYGQIVGGLPFDYPGGGTVWHAMLMSDGQLVDLDTLLPEGSGWQHLGDASAINNAGQGQPLGWALWITAIVPRS